MRLAASLYYGGLRRLGLTTLSRRLRNAGLILGYHNVVADGAEAAGDPGLHLSRDRFERQMRWLTRHYDVVNLAEFVARGTAGLSLRSLATVTFDDGYAGVFEHAVPILATLRIPATVFLVAEAVGRRTGFWWDDARIVQRATSAQRQRWLIDLRGDGEAIVPAAGHGANAHLPASNRPADWATIRAALRRGIDVGSHSVTHRSLTALGDDELENEIVTSRAIIHQMTGRRPEFFAYPYGLWDHRVRNRVYAAGYRGALTLDAGLAGEPTDPWALRRVNVPAGMSDAAFEAWTAGFRGRRSA